MALAKLDDGGGQPNPGSSTPPSGGGSGSSGGGSSGGGSSSGGSSGGGRSDGGGNGKPPPAGKTKNKTQPKNDKQTDTTRPDNPELQRWIVAQIESGRYTKSQIEGQVHRLHPSWTTEMVTRAYDVAQRGHRPQPAPATSTPKTKRSVEPKTKPASAKPKTIGAGRKDVPRNADRQKKPNKPEGLSHAITRMFDQGYDGHQVFAQIKKWNPGWTDEQIVRAMMGGEKGTTRGTLTSEAFFLGLPTDYGMVPLGAHRNSRGVWVDGANKPLKHPPDKPVPNLHVGDVLGIYGTVVDIKTFISHPNLKNAAMLGLDIGPLLVGAGAASAAERAALRDALIRKGLTSAEADEAIIQASKLGRLTPRKKLAAESRAHNERGALAGGNRNAHELSPSSKTKTRPATNAKKVAVNDDGSVQHHSARRWYWKGGEFVRGDKDVRIAPFGNRPTKDMIAKGEENPWQRRIPHYHRRVRGPDGVPVESQGVGRHRPWEKKAHDRRFRDRF